MPIIKNIDDLKPVVQAGRAVQKIAGAAETGDGWDRLERVITGIDQLMQTAIKFQQERTALGQNPKSAQNRDIMPSGGGDSRHLGSADAPAIRDIPKASTPVNSEKDIQRMEIQKKIIEVFANHIKACAKENPNMTFGEAIMKLPVDVTQLSVLFSLMQKGGEKND